MLKNKIPPPIVTLIFAALIYFSSEWSPSIVFRGQNLISLFLMTVGLIVLLIAISAFIKLKTTINPLKPEAASSLVTTGIFRISRNPMYLGMLLLIISLWIKTGAVLGFILVAGFIAYLNYFQILPEEQAMKGLFSDKYKTYCQQVRRWL
ncbi:isoprenylcysteine carboxylmethyltransferase family protein [Porticoccaceae bacterium]|jgi:protein-S-isoprenylcysteine O-methyltransferase Ste14|nr:isoprenylcysteine carboxylmethyltransferase family protein [Porticoccaceae bacterium]